MIICSLLTLLLPDYGDLAFWCSASSGFGDQSCEEDMVCGSGLMETTFCVLFPRPESLPSA